MQLFGLLCQAYKIWAGSLPEEYKLGTDPLVGVCRGGTLKLKYHQLSQFTSACIIAL